MNPIWADGLRSQNFGTGLVLFIFYHFVHVRPGLAWDMTTLPVFDCVKLSRHTNQFTLSKAVQYTHQASITKPTEDNGIKTRRQIPEDLLNLEY